ncbi:hypothetical protein E2C01_016247 [Portunus trituberculatus]|uniref:Uncharacterized protein n=1 Tax=Portunus trituberculatus TaxID=210409 RepID=A0A5B7DQ33_PORTR|nr:hypothetical protein [Portunus trituberculatus]
MWATSILQRDSQHARLTTERFLGYTDTKRRIDSLLKPLSLLHSSPLEAGAVAAASGGCPVQFMCGVCVHRVERDGSEGTVNTCTEHLQSVRKL